MKRVLLVGVGVLFVLAGVIFALQGSGAMGGGAMSGVTFWAVAGPVIALVGLVMMALGLRRGRVRAARHDQARSRQA
jgi:amino acid transporter